MAYGNNGWTTSGSLDWGEVSTAGPPPLEPGVYFVKCVQAEARPTKSKGEPSVAIQLVATGVYGGESITSKRRIFETLMFPPSEGAWRTKSFCQSCSLDLPGSIAFEDIRDFALDLVGMEAIATLIVGKDMQGQPQNRVGRFLTEEEAEAEVEGSAADSPSPAPAARKQDRASDTRASRKNERETSTADDEVDDHPQRGLRALQATREPEAEPAVRRRRRA